MESENDRKNQKNSGRKKGSELPTFRFLLPAWVLLSNAPAYCRDFGQPGRAFLGG